LYCISTNTPDSDIKYLLLLFVALCCVELYCMVLYGIVWYCIYVMAYLKLNFMQQHNIIWCLLLMNDHYHIHIHTPQYYTQPIHTQQHPQSHIVNTNSAHTCKPQSITSTFYAPCNTYTGRKHAHQYMHTQCQIMLVSIQIRNLARVWEPISDITQSIHNKINTTQCNTVQQHTNTHYNTISSHHIT